MKVIFLVAVGACVLAFARFLRGRASRKMPKGVDATPHFHESSGGGWSHPGFGFPWGNGPVLRTECFEWGLRVRSRVSVLSFLLPDTSWTWEQMERVVPKNNSLRLVGVAGMPSVYLGSYIGFSPDSLVAACRANGVATE